MATILYKITSIFLIMGVGFFLNRSRIIPSEAEKYFVNLLLFITTPCMILSSVTANEFSSEMMTATVEALLCGAGFFAVLFILGYLLLKKIMKVRPEEDIGVYIMAFSTVNNGFMGFPITNAIFGGSILYLMIIHNICLTVYMYSAGPFILNMNSYHGSFSFRRLLSTFRNPSTIISLIAVAMLFMGLKLPGLINESVTLVGDMTVPLSMMVVGMQLGESNIGSIIKNRSLVIMSLIKMFIIPVLIFLLVNWLPIDDSVKLTIVFASAFPAAVVTSALAFMESKNSTLAAEAIAFTTLISVICIPVCAVLLTEFYGI